LVTAGTTREVLNVAATRGRQSNRLYVADPEGEEVDLVVG
jgi:hypothetical protein